MRKRKVNKKVKKGENEDGTDGRSNSATMV